MLVRCFFTASTAACMCRCSHCLSSLRLKARSFLPGSFLMRLRESALQTTITSAACASDRLVGTVPSPAGNWDSRSSWAATGDEAEKVSVKAMRDRQSSRTAKRTWNSSGEGGGSVRRIYD